MLAATGSGSSALASVAHRARPAFSSCRRSSSILPAAVPLRVLPWTRLRPSTLARRTSSSSTIVLDTELSRSSAGETAPAQPETSLDKSLAKEPPSSASSNPSTAPAATSTFHSASLPDKLARFAARKARFEAEPIASKSAVTKNLRQMADRIWRDDPAWIPPLISVRLKGSGEEKKIELRPKEAPTVTTLVEARSGLQKTKVSAARGETDTKSTSKGPAPSPDMASTMAAASVPRASTRSSGSLPFSRGRAPAGTSTSLPSSPPRAVPRAVRRYAPNPLIKRTSVPISEAEIEIAFEPLVTLGWTIDVEPAYGRKDTAIRTALTRTLGIEDLRPGRQPTADPASEKDDFRQRSAKLVSVLAEIFMVHKHYADISFDDSKFEIKVTTCQTEPVVAQLAFPPDRLAFPSPTLSRSPPLTTANTPRPKVPTPSPHGLTGKDLALALSMHCAILDIGAMSSEELAGERGKA